MVELHPISTDKHSNSNASSSNGSPSSLSPNLPSPTSVLSPTFPATRTPLLPHHLFSPPLENPPSFQNYPINHQMIYFPFPQQPYFSYHPYYDNSLCYYPYPPPPVDPHYYPQAASDSAAAGLFRCVPVAYSAAGDGGCDGGAEVVVEAVPDHHYGGNRNRGGMTKRYTSGPRNFHGRRSFFGRCRVKNVWKPKKASSPSPPPRTAAGNCTTLMIKNIPNHISRRTLISLLESHCREQNQNVQHKKTETCSEKWRNLGYAFVNFTTVEAASRLYSCWNGMGWEGCSKIREITRARLQGKERCKKHFLISVFDCHSDE